MSDTNSGTSASNESSASADTRSVPHQQTQRQAPAQPPQGQGSGQQQQPQQPQQPQAQQQQPQAQQPQPPQAQQQQSPQQPPQPLPRPQQPPEPQGPGQAQIPIPQPGGGRAQPRVKAPKAPRAPKPPRQPKQPSQGGLSTFLKISIILLAALTVASISLIFLGDFEGKFERVFSTFMLFAVFVTFTALDTRRESQSEWYAPVALIANAYILGVLLIVIWVTPYDPFSLIWEILWKSIFVIVVIRLAILGCQLLLKLGNGVADVVTRFAFITCVLGVLSAILFTAPIGIEAFQLNIPDLYWKIATAMLILTALGLSIALLLRWSYAAPAREAKRQLRAQGQGGPGQSGQLPQGQMPSQPQPGQYPSPSAPVRPQQVRQDQLQGQQGQQGEPGQQSQPVRQSQPSQQAQHGASAPADQPTQSGAQPSRRSEQPLLPWPTFSDGRPLPAGPDGQPDFSARP